MITSWHPGLIFIAIVTVLKLSWITSLLLTVSYNTTTLSLVEKKQMCSWTLMVLVYVFLLISISWLKYYFSDIFHVLNFYLYVVIKNQLKNYLPRFLCLKVCLPLKEVRHKQIDMSRFTSLFWSNTTVNVPC